MPQVDKQRTAFTTTELREAMREALPASAAARDAWTAVVISEVGWQGAGCWHNNVGNVTTHGDGGADGWAGDWYYLTAPEFIGGQWVTRSLKYRVFDSLTAGVAAWVALMRSDYPEAARALDTGDVATGVRAMKKRGYFTAPLEKYLATATGVFAMLSKQPLAPPRTLSLVASGSSTAQDWYVCHYVVELARSVVPCDAADARMHLVCQGRHTAPKYSSCADLGHFVLWALGVCDDRIINRTDAELGITWRSGVNISELRDGARALGCWRDTMRAADVDARPEAGHIVLVGDRTGFGEEEHCFVVLAVEGDTIVSADLGQKHPDTGKQAGRIITRTASVRGGRLCIGSRRCLGWVLPEHAPRTRNALELPEAPLSVAA
jgi:hypothetical protein